MLILLMVLLTIPSPLAFRARAAEPVGPKAQQYGTIGGPSEAGGIIISLQIAHNHQGALNNQVFIHGPLVVRPEGENLRIENAKGGFLGGVAAIMIDTFQEGEHQYEALSFWSANQPPPGAGWQVVSLAPQQGNPNPRCLSWTVSYSLDQPLPLDYNNPNSAIWATQPDQNGNPVKYQITPPKGGALLVFPAGATLGPTEMGALKPPLPDPPADSQPPLGEQLPQP